MKFENMSLIYKEMNFKGFKYDSLDQVLAKVPEELNELKIELKEGNKEKIFEEMGDLILATTLVSDYIGIDPQEAFSHAYDKFYKRYEMFINIVNERDIDLHEVPIEEKLKIWAEVKAKLSK